MVFLRLKLFFLSLLVWGVAACFSPALALTDEPQAHQVARNFLGFLGSTKTIVSTQALETHILAPSKPAILAGWLMHLNRGGYILIAPSQVSSPIKAYSLTDDFDSLPPAFQQFLKTELEHYARMERAPPAQRTAQGLLPQTRAEKAWEFLLTPGPAGTRPLSYLPDTQLLTTLWNQGYPYNKFLPSIDGQQALAGCVNTALAQVMKYHGHPARGSGSTAFSWNNEILKTILDHPYYWDRMPDAPGMATPDHLQDEVALLFRDLAIVNQTDFGLDSSSTHLHQQAFVKFFGYSNTLASMDNSDTGTFFSTLKAQIDQKMPVLLSFPGHMVVVDGYKEDITGQSFHINMGWGGLDNHYYFLDQPVQTSSYIFPPSLDMLYNIKPCTGPDCILPEPPGQDSPPQFITLFQDMIIPGDQPHLIRLDARDENGDPIQFTLCLSNPDTLAAEIADDILTLTPLPQGLNQAATLRITAQAGGQSISREFLIMTTPHSITFGAEQTIQGKFETQNDAYPHQAILEGEVTLAGDRGYSNQAFYIHLQDSQGQTVIPATDEEDNAIHPDLPLGLYTIFASLRSGMTYYPYTPGDHDIYLIQINQSETTATRQQIAALAGVDLTRITIDNLGDINQDGQIDLADKLLALKIVTAQEDVPAFDPTHDASGDKRIGLEEALFWK